MRTFIIVFIFGLFLNQSFAQDDMYSAGKSDIYNKKGDYFFKKANYKKAIVYYNMAYKGNSSTYALLKKAEAYNELELYTQAEECYKIAFDGKQKIDNVHRLNYALVLISNNKLNEAQEWLTQYNNFVNEDIKGGNLIAGAESRVKLYKDSTLKIVAPVKGLSAQSNSILKTYLDVFPNKIEKAVMASNISIDGFSGVINHPTYNSSKTVMYFVSNISGGSGQYDIYKSRKIDGNWSQPQNVGAEINTGGNELYPFLYNDSILFFASNGHGGFGAFDLFSVNLMYSEKKIENLGNKVNSSDDDYNIYLEGNTGYFSSNRPNTNAEDGIYSIALLDFKIKYTYQPRLRTKMEEDKINIFISNGQEYNIAPVNGDFVFGFQPEENYSIVIQRENIEATDVLANGSLSAEQRKIQFMNPEPLQKAEVFVPAGMKYDFSAGVNPISDAYRKELNATASGYQDPKTGGISLTAIARELEFRPGEVYTIRFVKDDNKISTYKSKSPSTLFVNNEAVNVHGQSFIIVLPLKTEVSFNIKTDLATLKEKFSPKKYAVVVDESSVFDEANMIAMTVNTKETDEVKTNNRFLADDVSIIPGNEYILTLSKRNPATGEEGEIIIPLTKGVKYNLSSSSDKRKTYEAELAEFLTGREGVEPANEEVIDISFLSKELQLIKGEELSFNLMPVKPFGNKKVEYKNSNLFLDGKELILNKDEKYTVNVSFDYGRTLNIQTDIAYLEEHFEADAIWLSMDTLNILAGIPVDTTGLTAKRMMEDTEGYLAVSVNTSSLQEVAIQNQLTAHEVSIIPGKEYILTVSKKDYLTGEESEIIVPLTRQVKYDFTSNPDSEEAFKISLDKFLEGREDVETMDGEVIDISLLSKELQIKEGDEVSFSLLPVKDIFKKGTTGKDEKSSLYLDNHVVEFTQIQKYTIHVPLSNEGLMNIQTDIEYIQENFEPESFTLDVDTISFFSEISVDTTGYGDRVITEEEITDPVYDIVTVNFDLNKHELRPEAVNTIQQEVVNALNSDSRLYVTIKGYTDGLGNADYNKRLSKRRAESVKAYLTNNGIGESRIRTFSFGASQELDKGIKWEDLSEAELEKHRRVEIKIYLPE